MVEGIPVFAEYDEYTENYERIAVDLVEAMERTGENPFMSEETWLESEQRTRELLVNLVVPRGRVLDVGVGLGRLLGPLDELERYGIDIGWPNLRAASARGIECSFAKADDLPFVDAVFDVVVLTDVLEHVVDLNATLSEARRVLKPDGKVLVRVPYREDLSSYAMPGAPYDYVHLRAFDEFSLRLLLEKVARLRVLQFAFSGYAIDSARLKYPLPVGGKILVRALKVVRRIWPAVGARAVAGLMHPIEINVIACKDRQPSDLRACSPETSRPSSPGRCA